jgi:hypothetical protein
MNKIQTTVSTSEYSTEQHLTINVDGISLDHLLHRIYPQKEMNGLVPTLLHWLDIPEERALVWNRIESKEKQIVPILMCPDDRDLYCTIIHVEVEKTEQSINWLRFGIDSGDAIGMPNSIGTTVDWLDKVPSMKFKLIDYQNVISTFKANLENSKIKREQAHKSEPLNSTSKDKTFTTTEQKALKNRHQLKPIKQKPSLWTKLKNRWF